MVFPLTVRMGDELGSKSSKECGDVKYENFTKTELLRFLDRCCNAKEKDEGRWLYLDYKYVSHLFSEAVVDMFDWKQLGLPASANFVCPDATNYPSFS